MIDKDYVPHGPADLPKAMQNCSARKRRIRLSKRAINIIKSMANTDLDGAIQRARTVCGSALTITVIERETQTDIFLRHPDKDDRLHGHMAVETNEDGRKVFPCARPYAHSLRQPWRPSRS